MTENKKMGFNATWSMAVGGMVGGGIFSVLGVVIEHSAQWAWFSFLLAGIIAFISAHSYSQLSLKYKQSGGAFTFLNEINHEGLAGSLSWVLILGYVLTLSVYAFTFGHYVAHVFDVGGWLPRVLAFLVIGSLTYVNLRGVGSSSRVEIITVWGKLMILLGVSLFGLLDWSPEKLTEGIASKPFYASIVGAATIFMAYEGFQLLSYDYEDISHARTTLPKATLWAVVSVIGVYIIVAFGATMVVGAGSLVEKAEVALAVAGQKALGKPGLYLVTIAAAFSTGSAINATLFSTGRLMEKVSKKKDLPDIFTKENKANVPSYAIITIGSLGIVLAVIGSLGALVDAASLIFLITFGTVNLIAFRERITWRWLSLIGAVGCLAAIILSVREQISSQPLPLAIIIILILGALIGRPYILKAMNGKG